MRYLTSLLTFLIACSDSSSLGPIDPSDPLIRAWQNATVTGESQHGPGSFRWTFGADGTYQSVRPRVTPRDILSDVDDGRWDRGDDHTIRLCSSQTRSCHEPAELPFRLDGDRLLIDGRSQMNGEWSCVGEGACFTHGSWHAVTWVVTMHANGTAEEVLTTCSSATGIPQMSLLTGTWVESATSLDVTFSDPFSRPVRCPRIDDMVAGFAYGPAPG